MAAGKAVTAAASSGSSSSSSFADVPSGEWYADAITWTDARIPELDCADAAEISDWAYDAMAWCTVNGIIEGKDGGILDPKGKATRAEMAAMLMRFLSHTTEE